MTMDEVVHFYNGRGKTERAFGALKMILVGTGWLFQN